ncbi:MAG TPA: hypothetical protein PK644_09075 [bacterium]|nr:hypothetical protein [bacterium]
MTPVTDWLFDRISHSIIIGSRLRLARNFQGLPFPHQATAEESWKLLHQVARVLTENSQDEFIILEIEGLSEIDRAVLVEQHLISLEFAQENYPRAVVVFPDLRISMMVNEEDHIRLQGFSPGLSLKSLWKKIDRLDNLLDQHLKIAFHPVLGYLTACPSNLGSGFRASVLIHLPGLVLTRKHHLLFSALKDIGIVIRGWYGEGTPPAGHFFQVSSGENLGKTEAEVIHQMEIVVKLVVEEERKIRQEMAESYRWRKRLRETVEKFKVAGQLSTETALSFLSWLVLGAEWKMIGLNGKRFGQIIRKILPGHLQQEYGSRLSPAQRDRLRAKLLQKELREIYV